MHKYNGQVDIDAVMRDNRVLEEAGQRAVRAALLDHKRTGDPIVVWQDGKIVWIPADDIVVEDAPEKA